MNMMKVAVVGCGLAAATMTAACARSAVPSAAAAVTATPEPTRVANTITFDPRSPQLERLRVAPARAATRPVDEFDSPGQVQAVPTRLARMALPSAGRVRRVAVTLGDHVKAGDTLLTVETPEVSSLHASRRLSEVDASQKQAAVAKADADLARVRDLFTNRAVARKDLLAAETELIVARGALEQARAAQDDVERRMRLLGLGKEQGSMIALRAPMAGDVIEIAVAQGEYRNDTAAPVVTVADLAVVWVAANVPEQALPLVAPGQRLTIALTAYPNEAVEATVTRVSPTMDADTRTAKVIAALPNPRGRFRPEMFARVRYSGPARPVVIVPIGAIVHDDRRTTVFIEQAPGRFERRDVTLGPRRADDVVITRGLAAGDRVVVEGTMLLMER